MEMREVGKVAAFLVAAARVWNELPRHVTSEPSLRVSCNRHSTVSFLTSCIDCEVTSVNSVHYNRFYYVATLRTCLLRHLLTYLLTG